MKYENIIEGRFLSRPNRFTAYVDIGGKTEKVHVKNTGRCKELLVEGALVYLDRAEALKRSTNRITEYDLVAVDKNGRMINMDSNAPNKAVGEWLKKEKLLTGIKLIRPEKTYKKSRFDFYAETEKSKIFLEVKGVTLEKENAAYFPDAPSERAVKHVEELMEAVREGYEAYIIFVIQMKAVDYFSPNTKTQPAFTDRLIRAREAGVKILAYDCTVEADEMNISEAVPVKLTPLDFIAAPLLSWYDGGRRILPWRENPMPYNVWLSEIMLQQTRVEAVKPYFDRFINEVPDIESLAAIEEERLMKLWEGLGYYNRARNLKKAAQQIIEQYGGIMPAEYKELLSLPGIGSYTAGAIASIAYGKQVPAVDGNVLRVLARLRADEEDILSFKTKQKIEKELSFIMPSDRAGDFNQALMELGATVCIPNGMPKCHECPWHTICEAGRLGRQLEFPKKKKKKARRIEEKTVLVIKGENKTAVIKRPDKGLLAGLYGFPTYDGILTEKQIIGKLKEEGYRIIRIQKMEEAKHIFSHVEWHMSGYVIKVDELELPDESKRTDGFLFIDREDAGRRYAIPSAYAAYRKYLDRDI